jgi:PmbA protein
MTQDLEILAAEGVAWMRAQSPATQAEIYLSRSRDRELERRAGERDGVEVADSLGAAVRVVRDGRVGFASTGAVDAQALRTLWRRAVEQCPHAEPDSHRSLPGGARPKPDAALARSLWDESLFRRSWAEIEEKLLGAEKAVSGRKNIRLLRASLSESRGEVVVANTNGLIAVERGGSAALSISAAAEDGGETQVGEGYRSARSFEAMDAVAAGTEASLRAAASIGAGRARAGRRVVIFESWVGVEFLELLGDLLSAEEVQGGRSLLASRLGSKVASPLVTLRDEPRRLGGPGSSQFDDEGISTVDKTLIDRGVLTGYLYDSTTASRDGVASNGCGYRDGWSSRPGPSASNLILTAGTQSREALISGTKDGLLVLEVLGVHMVDPVSGEFSVGVSGFQIEKGALARPFKGAMLSGNLLDLFTRIDGLADDLTFHASVASPTFRVKSLDVA